MFRNMEIYTPMYFGLNYRQHVTDEKTLIKVSTV
jgi:hypothetical protein